MKSQTLCGNADFTKTDVTLDKYMPSSSFKYSFTHTKRLLNIKRCTFIKQSLPLMKVLLETSKKV